MGVTRRAAFDGSYRDRMPGNQTRHDPVSAAVSASARRLLRVVLFSGLINMLTLSGSMYMLQVYDRVIPSRDATTLAGLSVIVLMAYLLQGYLDALRARMLTRIAAQFDVTLQQPLFAALAGLPLAGASLAETQQPLRDLDQVRGFLASSGPTAFLDMPWIPLFLVILFLFHPAIGSAALAGAVAIILVTVLTERRSSHRSRNAAAWIARRQVLADATRSNAEVIRALGMASRFSALWSSLNESALAENLEAMDIHANLGALGKVLRYTLQSALLGLGALLVINEQASGGIMIASSIVMGRALAPIEVALATWRQMTAAREGLHRLRSVLLRFDSAQPQSLPFAPPARQLWLRSAAIAVPGTDQRVVTGVSCSLEAGTGLALIGPSGSGKSSLVRGLVGVWPLVEGEICLDGIAIGAWPADTLGAHLGYLPQDAALFDGTVADNISRFDPMARASAVIEAAQLAGAHDLICGLPAGYHTRIGPGGSALSAGQRQRVGLARAVFNEPFLVVLDEPDANLDTDGEAALIVAIHRLRRRGSIVIVATHRASVIAALDTVLVLVAGRVMATGPRSQVQQAFSRVDRGHAAARA